MNGFEQKITWCFWFGGEMTKNRFSCYQNLKLMQSNVILITEKNIQDFILKQYPLHECYEYLSSTHKSDYLRSYFMNYYGGAYTDIKKQSSNWDFVFDKIEKDDLLGSGYREICSSHLAKSITNPKHRNMYSSFVGCGAFIYKPDTQLTNEWIKNTQQKMDSISILLRKYPGNYHPRAISTGALQTNEKPRGYPLGWTCLMGDIYHPLVYKYSDKINKQLPKPIMKDYR